MRLLQKSLRKLLLYSLLLVVLSIPVSLISMNYFIRHEVDETLRLYKGEFITHVKQFEYLEDLETDLLVVDNIIFDIDINATDDSPFEDSFQTTYEYDSLENDTRPFRALTSKIVVKDKPYLLTIRSSLIDNQELVLTLSAVQALLVLFLALGLVLINRSLSLKLWKPFYKTLGKLKAYELDKHKDIDFEQTDIVEFNDLNKTVGQLTDKNRRVFLQQKEFIENLSHEMQTPLAVFHSKVDMLMQNPDLNEEQSLLIQDLTSSLQKLTKLNKNMLLLSKIENEQFTDWETFDLSVLISTLVNHMKPIADLRDIDIYYEQNPQSITGNKMLIEMLMTNLLSNAIRYNEPGGKIIITNENEKLTFSNTGKPMEIPIEKLFDRFVKGSTPGGTGLGLAIVKKICDASGYELKYDYLEDMHQFTVYF